MYVCCVFISCIIYQLKPIRLDLGRASDTKKDWSLDTIAVHCTTPKKEGL